MVLPDCGGILKGAFHPYTASAAYIGLSVTLGIILFMWYGDTDGDNISQGYWPFVLFYGLHEPLRYVEIRLSTVYFVFCLIIAAYELGVLGHRYWASTIDIKLDTLHLFPRILVSSLLVTWIGLPLVGQSELQVMIILSAVSVIFAATIIYTVSADEQKDNAAYISRIASFVCFCIWLYICAFSFATCYGVERHANNTTTNPVSDESYLYGLIAGVLNLANMFVYWIYTFNGNMNTIEGAISYAAHITMHFAGYAILIILFIAVRNEANRSEVNPTGVSAGP